MDRNFTLLGLVALTFLAVAALAGFPIVPPEALAGIGMLPFAGWTDDDESPTAKVKRLIEEQGANLKCFVQRNDSERAEMKQQIEQMQIKMNRPNFGGGGPLHREAAREALCLPPRDGRGQQLRRHQAAEVLLIEMPGGLALPGCVATGHRHSPGGAPFLKALRRARRPPSSVRPAARALPH